MARSRKEIKELHNLCVDVYNDTVTFLTEKFRNEERAIDNAQTYKDILTKLTAPTPGGKYALWREGGQLVWNTPDEHVPYTPFGHWPKNRPLFYVLARYGLVNILSMFEEKEHVDLWWKASAGSKGTILHEACYWGQTAVVAYLLSLGVPSSTLHATNTEDETCLDTAEIARGHWTHVLAHGDQHKVDEKLVNPLQVSLKKKQHAMLAEFETIKSMLAAKGARYSKLSQK